MHRSAEEIQVGVENRMLFEDVFLFRDFNYLWWTWKEIKAETDAAFMLEKKKGKNLNV